MNGAESLVRTLIASGVEVCFANRIRYMLVRLACHYVTLKRIKCDVRGASGRRAINHVV